MNRLAIASLAAIFACGSAWSVASAQEHHDRGHHYGWPHRGQNGNPYGNQCGNAQYGQRRGGDRDDRDDNDDDNRGQNGQYGQYGNGQYGQYGNGQYGQYGNCGGSYGAGNAVVRGQIVAVNGNEVTLRVQNGGYNNGGYGGYGNPYGQTITINDQPALNNQASGRVETGRYVTAYGYWQNGVFYATRMV